MQELRDDRAEMTVWAEEDLGRFLAHTGADRLSALWLLLATTGMRRGEALGLRWADVEWPRNGDAGWVSARSRCSTASRT